MAVAVGVVTRLGDRGLLRREVLCRGSRRAHPDDRELYRNPRVLHADLAWDSLESVAFYRIPFVASYEYRC